MFSRLRLSFPPDTATSTRSAVVNIRSSATARSTCAHTNSVRHALQKAVWWRGMSSTAFALHLRQRIALASRDDWPDLDPVLVLEQLVFRHQIVAPNHQNAFRQEVQFFQHFSDAPRPLDFHFTDRMVQQDLHLTRPPRARRDAPLPVTPPRPAGTTRLPPAESG